MSITGLPLYLGERHGEGLGVGMGMGGRIVRVMTWFTLVEQRAEP